MLIKSYVLRRIIKAVFTIFLITSLVFFIVRLMPGNPVDIYISQLIIEESMSYTQALDQAAALFQLDFSKPVLLQYFEYLGNLLQGNLGLSFRSKGTPAADIIFKYLPWTLFCVGSGLVFSFVIGLLLGMVAGFKRNSPLDIGISSLAALVGAIPNYLIAIMFIVVMGSVLNILPFAKIRGSLSPGVQPEFSLNFVQDVLFHAWVPILIYVLSTVGNWVLLMKSSTTSTLEEDFVTVARARGLKERRILTQYVGRNAMLPLITQLAISIGFVVAGSFAIETLFVYQGVGALLLQSIQARDYPVVQGIVLIITVTVVTANLLVDLLYSRLDPRIRVR